jgi:hypothetical protein
VNKQSATTTDLMVAADGSRVMSNSVMPIPGPRRRSRRVSFARVERGLANVWEDLCLFVSLQLALLMVWRITRRRAKENAIEEETGDQRCQT